MVSLKSLLIAGAALMLPMSANAAVTFNLTLTPNAGSTIGGTGTLTLASAPSVSGITDYAPAQVSALTFTIGGQTFSKDDPGVSFNLVRFLDGSLNHIGFAEQIGLTPNRFALHTSGVYAFYYGNLQLASYGKLSATLAPVAPQAVPEPATWAMMIGGFGLAGAAMRRRQRIVSTSFA